MSRRIRLAPGQHGIFEEPEEDKLAKVPGCLFASSTRGVAARAAEFEMWKEEFGSFGSSFRSHAWTSGPDVPAAPSERCQAAILHADVRQNGYDPQTPAPECGCTIAIDAMLYRGACRGRCCDWEGPARREENLAVEDACDHAWPGWRNMPVVAGWPHEKRAQARWLERVAPLYPDGWLEAGGPVRTARKPRGTRHNGMHATPWGGYDMGVLEATT